MLRRLGLGILLIAIAPAYGEIYKYVDEEGRVTYTNIPKRGAKRLNLDPSPTKSQRSNTGPVNFPRVDQQTQKKRDDTRKAILEDELATEQKALADAQRALKDGEATRQGDEVTNYPKYLDRIKRLKDNVALHERNVEALKKELADFR